MCLFSIRARCNRLSQGASGCCYGGDLRHDLDCGGGIGRVASSADVCLVGKYYFWYWNCFFTLYGVCFVEK